MRKLGQLLLADGVITQAQLDEGLQSQVAFGGRLGTNLVELDLLTLDQLAEQLSKQLRVPIAPYEWLEKIATTALRLLPMDLIRRFRALPLKAEPTMIHVVMLDPRAPHHIADIAAATSRRVQPYVLPELRLYYWLERHYAIARGPRYMFAQAEATPERAAAQHASTQRVAAQRAQPIQELTDEDTFDYGTGSGATPPAALTSGPTPKRGLPETPLMSTPEEVPLAAPIILGVAERPREAAARPREAPSRAAEIVALERDLKAAADRDEIIDKCTALALAYVRCVALFIVHRGEVQAIRIAGEAKGHVPLERIGLPLSVECIITNTASSGEVFHGKVPYCDIDEKILRALGRRLTKEAAVFPVKIRNRVVNALYVDNGVDEIPPSAHAAIASVAESMSLAYERLILERKKLPLG